MLNGTRVRPAIVLVCFLLTPAISFASDWIAVVRSCVEKKDFECARSAVQEELREHPGDVEALTWRARLAAWSGDFAGAAAQYRQLVQLAPNNADILLGLADVQVWSGDFAAAIVTLGDAEQANAALAEVLPRRAKALAGLHRTSEALACYRQLLVLEPANSAARQQIRSLRADTPVRHQLRIGSDTDTLSYTDPATYQSISLTSQWNRRWTSQLNGSFCQRFGETAQVASAGATYHVGQRDWITAVGGVGNRQDVAPRYQFSFDYGHSFPLHLSVISGLEVYVQQRRLWFVGSIVATFGTTAIIYLPREWTWTISGTAVRTDFQGAGTAWAPSGFSRLEFPVHHGLRANLLYGVGGENFSKVDQIGQFAAHSIGGGLRFQINPHHDISGYVAVQNRSQGRSQVSVGVSYGIRF